MRGEIERWVRQARESQTDVLRARLGSYDRMRWASLARGDQALVARYDALIQNAQHALRRDAAAQDRECWLPERQDEQRLRPSFI